MPSAAIAQLGERQTEDLKVPGSIPGLGITLALQRETCCRLALRCLCAHGVGIFAVPQHVATDTLAEWLRRRPAKPMGSPRVGSNPTGVASMHLR